jgi:hypothetical protein
VTTALGDPYPYPPVKGFVYPPLNKPYAIATWYETRARVCKCARFHCATRLNSSSGRAVTDEHEFIIVDTGTRSTFCVPLLNTG